MSTKFWMQIVFAGLVLVLRPACCEEPKPVQVSGVYPHLAFFNEHGECGIGGIVPWAGKLWSFTYPPHFTHGSTDKLYEIDEKLNLTIRPESVGGTHACRLIHRESNQLIIGVYFIDDKGKVRAADIKKLTGRMTAIARHLTDPANKVYFYDMEGAVYEVDVHTLEITRLFEKPVPGWHGKGGYSGQGRLVISNNGESAAGKLPKKMMADWPAGDPEAAGVLAEWNGKDWRIIERRQFTEVTGPGGINGNAKDTDPIWATGWDKRSVILKMLDGGNWLTYRMPKASHAFDPKHGWYTEWPRIREIAPGRAMMTMHGMMWNFPLGFSAANTGGISPMCSHLRYVTDVCTWNGKLLISSDDTSIMQNPMAGVSHSNIWFTEEERLKTCGPRSGWGGVWLSDAVKANAVSVPFLVNGFDRRVLHLALGNGLSGKASSANAVGGDTVNRCTGSLPMLPLPEALAGLTRVSIGRGDMRKPAPDFSFTVNQDVTVFIAVDNRPKPELGEGWEKTPMETKWSKGSDIVYKKDFKAGKVHIPGHPAAHKASDYGVPHLAFVKPIGNAVPLEITHLPNDHLTPQVVPGGVTATPTAPAAAETPAPGSDVTFTLEIDAKGDGQWSEYKRVTVPAGGYTYHIFPNDFSAQWLRIKTDKDCVATAYFHESAAGHDPKDANLFASVADVSDTAVKVGLLRPNTNLLWLANESEGAELKDTRTLEVNEKLAFAVTKTDVKDLRKVLALKDEFSVDSASVIMTQSNKRYRLPKGAAQFDKPFAWGTPRCIREVESERTLVNMHGTFYEMPRQEGLPLIKPVASHSKQIMDFCTWRGMLVLSGTKPGAKTDGQFFAAEGGAGLWFGCVDDLWKLGKPVGKGGPWLETAVAAGETSDPYLMTGYDKKQVQLWHDAKEAVEFTLEVDVDHHKWLKYQTVVVPPGEKITHVFPEGYSAHWVRVKSNKACKASAMFTYE